MKGKRRTWHVGGRPRLRLGMLPALLLLLWTGAAIAEPTMIRAGHLITDASAEPRGPTTIVVDNGRIVAIVDGVSSPAPAGARVVDLSRYTVMPGLIDTHVHLIHGPGMTGWNNVNRSREYGVTVAIHNANTLVQAGFTTVRDLGPEASISQAVRDSVAAGLNPGPRVVAAAMLSIIGGHGQAARLNPLVMDALGHGGTCTGADQCAAEVRLAARNGADAIKIMVTGGSLSGSRGLNQQFTDAELRAIVATAHSLHMRVAAHCSGADGVRAAALAGVDSIEHGTFGQDAEAQLMRPHGIMLAPTIMAMSTLRENAGRGLYSPEVEARNAEVISVIGRMIVAARRAGVRIVFGTDSGVFAHGRNAEEALYMSRIGGMAPREILIAATTTAAELLDLTAETGTISVGKAADIIAVEGDPLQDLTALQRVHFVTARGRVVRDEEGQ